MPKKKKQPRSAALFTTLERMTSSPGSTPDPEDDVLDLTSLADQAIRVVPDSSRTLRMKKFRAQLLHVWLENNFQPCRAADIGGGKGLLGHLLNRSGWDVTVIDPVGQPLPDKYKDIRTEQRVKVRPDERVARIEMGFQVEMGADFDLLIGMHAHACNAKVIDAAALYGCGFVLFPCCVIDEPFYPRLGVHWLECLAAYALERGLDLFPFRLNFKGQNIGLCHVGKCTLRT